MPTSSSPSFPTVALLADASPIARQGMDVVSVQRHGTRGKDLRVFIVARKPA